MRDELIKVFTEQAEGVAAEVCRADDLANAYRIVVDIFKAADVQKVGFTEKSLADGLYHVLLREGFSVSVPKSNAEACGLDAGVISADAGIAETGTVYHDATDLTTRLITTLPLISIVFLNTKNIVPNLPEALTSILAGGKFPGYLAFISGPSRTADIERILTIGVHGPGRLIIILIEDGEGES